MKRDHKWRSQQVKHLLDISGFFINFEVFILCCIFANENRKILK